ncbi:MAG: tetratricopeptide repeat protein [Pirellulaceae bacterium]
MSDKDLAQTIFLNALEIADQGERDAYLESQCQGSSELRREVDELLGHAGRLGRFMEGESPGQAATELNAVIEKPGTRVGPYKLLQDIGEGGMGVVYLAEQTEPVERRVALKVIKPGMDSRQVIARFEAERQALALMDHPNIAKVLDAGTTLAGRPYFVMELVNGIPVTQFCDEQHLNTRERLELFIPICQAVQHAHQKGIIHRDLKPSNILIALYDGRPVPKVIDFGVAKAVSQRLTNKTMFTGLGQIIGTLEYMSPEQAQRNQLDIDTRSDIYSLGVVLYELLTGDTPFDKQRLRSAALDELLRIIREEEPPRPSTKLSGSDTLPSVAANRRIEPARLSKLMRGELDWIVMKTLEKDRARRYETANALAADLERFLHDEPVVACPPSAIYCLRKMARRHRSAVAVSAITAGLVLALAVGAGWVLRDREAIRRQAAHELQEERDRIALEKEQKQRLVEEAATDALEMSRKHYGAQAWYSALSEARRAAAAIVGTDISEELSARVQQQLKDMEMVWNLDDLQTIPPDWNLDSRTASYRQVFQDYGIDVTVGDVDEVAQALLDSHVAPELVDGLDGWAHGGSRVTDPESLDLRRRLLTIASNVDDDALRRRMRQAMLQKDLQALRAITELENQPEASIVMLAESLDHLGDSNRAANVLLQAQLRFRKSFRVHHRLSLLLLRTSPPRPSEALRFSQAAVVMRPQSPGVFNNLGLCLRATGNSREAVAAYRMGLEVGGENYRWSGIHVNLGRALSELAEFSEAEKHYRRALELDPNGEYALLRYGDFLTTQDRVEEGVSLFRQVLEMYPTHPQAHGFLGDAFKKEGQFDRAEEHYRMAIELEPEKSSARAMLATILSNRGNLDEALPLLREACELGPTNFETHFNLGVLCEKLGQHAEAVESFRRSVELDPRSVVAHTFLATNLWRDKQFNEAVVAFYRAIELAPDDFTAHNNLGVLLLEEGRLEEAVPHLEQAAELNPERGPYESLGDAARQFGKLDEAIAYYDRALLQHPERSRPHANRAICLLSRGRTSDAVEGFRHALSLDTENADYHNNLGVALIRQGNHAEAFLCFQRALELEPNSAGRLRQLAWFLVTTAEVESRDPRRAIELTQRATTLEPANPSAWHILGLARYRAGEFEEAVSAYDQGMRLGGKISGFNAFTLAMAHWQQGHPQVARWLYDHGVAGMAENQPQDPTTIALKEEAEALLGASEADDLSAPDGR